MKPAGSSGGSSSRCCGCSSWLVYALSVLSLLLSFVVFWVALYKHQEVFLELQHVKVNLNTSVARSVEPHLAAMKRVLMNNERRTDRIERQVDRLRRGRDMDRDEVEPNNALRMVEEIRSNHGSIINALNARLTDLSSDKQHLMAAMKGLEADLGVVESNQVELKAYLDKTVKSVVEDVALIKTNLSVLTDSDDELKRQVYVLEQARARVEDGLLGAEDGRQRLETWLIRHGEAIELIRDEFGQSVENALKELNDKRATLEEALRASLSEMAKSSELSSLAAATSGLETRLEEQAAQTQVDRAQLEVLDNKVKHFVRNVLKVKTLPAKLSRLEARLDTALKENISDDNIDNNGTAMDEVNGSSD